MKPALPSYAQAASLVASHAAQLGQSRPAQERVELGHAAGRILAQPLVADRDQPPFARSTCDGFVCRAAEASTHVRLVIAGAARAGDPPSGPLLPGTAWEIMNGAPVPSGADAVAMLKDVETTADAKVRKLRLLPPRNLKPGENIVAQGAQARAGDALLPAGTALHSGQIALAAACGCAMLDVFVRPRVAILATGDELVSVEALPAAGQIRNSNAAMLAAMVAAAGGDPWVLPTAADNSQALNAAFADVLAASADLLIISGGVSAGKFDLVEPALARIGARFHFTGVRIQPGKPAVFGELHRRADAPALSFLGLPGNPVSSAVCFLLFAAPLVAVLAGSREARPRFALARLAAPVDRGGKPGLTRFLPAFCDFGATAGQPPQVFLVQSHGSGDLVALARSNCFLVLPDEAGKLKPGALVRVLLS